MCKLNYDVCLFVCTLVMTMTSCLVILIRALPPQGEGNHGFEVLMQNLKAGVSASKELGEFIRER